MYLCAPQQLTLTRIEHVYEQFKNTLCIWVVKLRTVYTCDTKWSNFSDVSREKECVRPKYTRRKPLKSHVPPFTH